MLTESIKNRNERYNKYVNSIAPKSSAKKALTHAFLIGGLTCILGQGIANLIALAFPQFDPTMVGNVTSMILVATAVLLTGFGWYGIIARHGGAGSFLPITGFANAMASASIEFKTEGMIFGTSTKMFTVVGPVVVNGIVWSTVAGLLRLVISLIFI